MKPIEIISALPGWASASPETIVASPAFAMPCRLGEEGATLRLGAVRPAETIDVSVVFENEPHMLGIARSPRFPDLDAIWDCRGEMPEPVLLALVEKDCGRLFQMLENAVRRQLKVTGLVSGANADQGSLCAQVEDVVFTITRSKLVVAAFGNVRNLDLAHPDVRSETIPVETEYAAFSMPFADLSALAPGDAVLLPEIGSVPVRLIADGRFVVDGEGVSPNSDDELVHVRDLEPRVMTLGELFDASEGWKGDVPQPRQLRLVQGDKTFAAGSLGKIGGLNALVVENT